MVMMRAGHRYGFNVLWSAEDEAYIAVCPEFPRLSGFGDTADEALLNMEGVLHEALATYREEGWPLPEPRNPADDKDSR